MAEDNNKREAAGRVELDTDEARAGTTPGMTRYILGISLVLVVALFVIIWWAY